MQLEKVNIAFDHKIVEGSEYQWKCYGPNARYLDYQTDHVDGSVIYDTKTMQVYEVIASNKNDYDARPYRYLDPSTKERYYSECKDRGIDCDLAYDDIKYIDLEVEEDFLQKAAAMSTGQNFDKRIMVPLDLTKDELFDLMCIAHEKDITLNKLVEEILQGVIKNG